MQTFQNGRRRVVVTGIGALSPLGALPEFWEGVKTGRSGIRQITQFDYSDLGVHIAGEVDFEPKGFINPKDARRMSRSSKLALIAAMMALEDAGLTHEDVRPQGDRVGVMIGTVNAGFATLVELAYGYTYHGRRIFPTGLVNGLPNMPGHFISAEMGARGPLAALSTACASGTQGIGAGVDLISFGKADMVFTGGVDALIRKEILAAFEIMTVLSSLYNETPEMASRPFDADRDGFVMGEGAGLLILESLEHAQERGARIYAEVLGHASSSDAFHSAAPDEEGYGAVRAMDWALQDAGLRREEVDYINAHGTGTRVNDVVETRAIKQLFGDSAYTIPISSTKSMIGHCMGAAGALEAITSIMALADGIIPPTINYETPDPECDLDYVPNVARTAPIQTALSNSFGLGGQNACLVFSRWGD